MRVMNLSVIARSTLGGNTKYFAELLSYRNF